MRIDRGTAVGTVKDDDAPPSVSVEAARVTEGHTSLADAQPAVRLSGPSGKTVTVRYGTTDGSAVAPGDYGAAEGAVVVPAGQTVGAIHLAVRGDTTVEAAETFTVTLSAPENATLGTVSATVTIADDEPLRVDVASPSVKEGNSGSAPATFTVTLTPPAPAGMQVSVPYTVKGLTATVPDDVTSWSGTVTFAAGETTKQVTAQVQGDTTPEPNETFRLELGTPSATDGRVVLAGDATVARRHPLTAWGSKRTYVAACGRGRRTPRRRRRRPSPGAGV